MPALERPRPTGGRAGVQRSPHQLERTCPERLSLRFVDRGAAEPLQARRRPDVGGLRQAHGRSRGIRLNVYELFSKVVYGRG